MFHKSFFLLEAVNPTCVTQNLLSCGQWHQEEAPVILLVAALRTSLDIKNHLKIRSKIHALVQDLDNAKGLSINWNFA